ncbi:SRPBCC domain-containing protein [Microbacterium sp. zg-YB36]|uniref:SRPBCC family protein n=1 Tax=Microbacterium sp. zg-YB36 TaxID=2969407 RepID=UPI00214B8167|nr:SRPBCC domain-containing protein [Microbacterium sp. zg-YB36]MDL5351258.1 SRPBCC domain-containing protein [Microbacterium sp. zg-YB36]
MAEHRSTVDIAAAPERVFEYLVTAAGITAWMGDWARVEPTPGGEFAVNIAGYGARGTFLEVDRPRRVTVSWGFEGSDTLPPGASTVSFELSETADGTRLEVIHTDLPEGEVAGHVGGWEHFVPRLALAATGQILPPDSWTPRP